ncbi:nuclear transport factor 2 family protein [Thalassotalea sediminis]|uniref:nuclear transport factor 2 family protein n=1 Tax=Thalassotalea sediminis TaxID=1759089 RepID=UPI0025731BCA|nr:nuclear transport factor 2 family protein [Thalassotalea sediminis]
MRSLILGSIFFTAQVFSQTHYQGDKTQVKAVETTVNYYLEGSIAGDPSMIKKAFHPNAKVQGIKNDQHKVYDMNTFLSFFSKDKPGKHKTSIISVDIENNAASVRAEWDMGTWKYVDYLSLLKQNNEWKIVNKIYTVVQK